MKFLLKRDRVRSNSCLCALVLVALLAAPLSAQVTGMGDFNQEPYVSLIDTSLFLNGSFKLGAFFWDKPGLQMPSGGELHPYDPDNDPGFNSFTLAGNALELQPGEAVQQRILLSPGANVVIGRFSTYQSAGRGWSAPVPFREVIENPHDMHLMETFTLEARSDAPTRYTGLKAFCTTPVVSPEAFLDRIEEELRFALDLHLTTSALVDPGPDSAWPSPGMHAFAKYADYRDLQSTTPFFQTLHVPSPHADLYLTAARHGFSEYELTAYQYARGVLAALGKPVDYYLPYRYVFNQQVWVPPEEGKNLVLYNLLNYLCEAADHFKDIDFFVAAYVVAKQMIDRNWWKIHSDPEGLFFISDKYYADADGVLNGFPIIRTPQGWPGASVAEDSEDHRMMLAAAAISRFLRLMHENADYLGYNYLEDPFILECFGAVLQSLQSFVSYADLFLTKWIVSHADPTLLTAAWWSNYDRRDDFMGYNLGLAIVPILKDQSAIFGYVSLKEEEWVQRIYAYLDAYQPIWDENAKRGGKEASDTYRFYKCFRDLRVFDEGRTWSDAYLSTYFAGLVQMVKGFIFDGEDPEIGTWEIWDFAPQKSFFAKEVTVPGVLFSWAADVYVITREYGNNGAWLVTLMDSLLNTIRITARGEAGYEKDLNIPEIIENGGEFRLAVGLFDMLDALKEQGAISTSMVGNKSATEPHGR